MITQGLVLTGWILAYIILTTLINRVSCRCGKIIYTAYTRRRVWYGVVPLSIYLASPHARLPNLLNVSMTLEKGFEMRLCTALL